ncbi:MAG: hypothetical protein ACFFD2_09305 [Promethearchaeota archaeon]
MVEVALVKGEKILNHVPKYDSIKVVKKALDLLGGMKPSVKKDGYMVLKSNYGAPIPKKQLLRT